jgi:hypothetical protein
VAGLTSRSGGTTWSPTRISSRRNVMTGCFTASFRCNSAPGRCATSSVPSWRSCEGSARVSIGLLSRHRALAAKGELNALTARGRRVPGNTCLGLDGTRPRRDGTKTAGREALILHSLHEPELKVPTSPRPSPPKGRRGRLFTSPSPLNGERAGVRGENVQRALSGSWSQHTSEIGGASSP